MEERYVACMILHALGDTIGFKNGEWEFLGQKMDIANALSEKLNDFFQVV